ncbi:hypothetical protein [Streptomyces cyaneofuscatus]
MEQIAERAPVSKRTL